METTVQCRKGKEGWERKERQKRGEKRSEKGYQEYRVHIIYGPITRLIVCPPSLYSLSPFLLIFKMTCAHLSSAVLCSRRIKEGAREEDTHTDSSCITLCHVIIKQRLYEPWTHLICRLILLSFRNSLQHRIAWVWSSCLTHLPYCYFVQSHLIPALLCSCSCSSRLLRALHFSIARYSDISVDSLLSFPSFFPFLSFPILSLTSSFPVLSFLVLSFLVLSFAPSVQQPERLFALLKSHYYRHCWNLTQRPLAP